MHRPVLSFLAAACLLQSEGLEEIPANRKQQIEMAAPAKAQATPKRPRKVLVLVTPPHLMDKDPHKGYCIPYGAYAFAALGAKTGAYQALASDDISLLLPGKIQQFDAIVLNNTSGPWIVPTEADLAKSDFANFNHNLKAAEETLRASFLDYVKSGGGIVAVHYAAGANPKWPEFKELIGGYFVGHPWNEEVGIHLEEPAHPLLAGFGRNDFRVADEIYEYGAPYDRAAVRVLLSLDPQHSNMNVPWIHRDDNDFALAWVKPYGKGRVFCTSFGHRTEIYWDRRILALYLNAVQFATGDLPGPAEPRGAAPEDGFVSLFNGLDLSQWEGDQTIWKVQDGTITGETSESTKVRENNFLVWKGGEPENFELRAKFKLIGGNSGIYFHSERRAPGSKGEALVGPQADFSADHRWTGVLMEYTKREILAERGQRMTIDEKGNKKLAGSVGDPARLLKAVKDEDWNEYTLLVRGQSVLLKINGVLMCEVTDKDPRRTQRGLIALQVHTGPRMRVQFKDLRLKQF